MPAANQLQEVVSQMQNPAGGAPQPQPVNREDAIQMLLGRSK